MSTLREAAPVQQSAPASGTVTIINASGINFRYRDLVSLVITTTAAAIGVLTISDGTKTTHVLNYPNAALAPGSPLVMLFDPPVQQSGNGNAAWTITLGTAQAYNVTAQYVER